MSRHNSVCHPAERRSVGRREGVSAAVVMPRRASTALRWATERAPVPAQVTNGDGHAGGGVGNVAVRYRGARTARAHRAPTDGWAMGEGEECWHSVGWGLACVCVCVCVVGLLPGSLIRGKNTDPGSGLHIIVASAVVKCPGEGRRVVIRGESGVLWSHRTQLLSSSLSL